MTGAEAGPARPKSKPPIKSGSNPTFNNTAIVTKISGLLLSPIALNTVLIKLYPNKNNIPIKLIRKYDFAIGSNSSGDPNKSNNTSEKINPNTLNNNDKKVKITTNAFK